MTIHLNSLKEFTTRINLILNSNQDDSEMRKKVFEDAGKVFKHDANNKYFDQIKMILNDCFEISFDANIPILEELNGSTLKEFRRSFELYSQYIDFPRIDSTTIDQFYKLTLDMLQTNNGSFYWLNENQQVCL